MKKSECLIYCDNFQQQHLTTCPRLCNSESNMNFKELIQDTGFEVRMQQQMEVKFNTVTHVTGKSPAFLKHCNSPPSPKLSILKIHSIQAYYKKKIGLIFVTRWQMLFKVPRRESVLADQKLKCSFFNKHQRKWNSREESEGQKYALVSSF